MAGRVPMYDPTAPTGPIKSKPRGKCPVCDRDRPLRKDGTLAQHTRTRYLPVDGNYGPRSVQVVCRGSHGKPEVRS